MEYNKKPDIKYEFMHHNIKLGYASWGATHLKIEIAENYGYDYYWSLESEAIMEWFPMKEIFYTNG